eukprot:scaffold13150_cov62-Phaeocystis_antarctica.AAC.5
MSYQRLARAPRMATRGSPTMRSPRLRAPTTRSVPRAKPGAAGKSPSSIGRMLIDSSGTAIRRRRLVTVGSMQRSAAQPFGETTTVDPFGVSSPSRSKTAMTALTPAFGDARCTASAVARPHGPPPMTATSTPFVRGAAESVEARTRPANTRVVNIMEVEEGVKRTGGAISCRETGVTRRISGTQRVGHLRRYCPPRSLSRRIPLSRLDAAPSHAGPIFVVRSRTCLVPVPVCLTRRSTSMGVPSPCPWPRRRPCPGP